MSALMLSLPELFENYKAWVSKNPLVASDFETSTKWISYFIAGRINNSSILSELIYSLSNLLVLFNDRIISNTRKLNIPQSGDQLKIYLTVIEYSEVFFELSIKKVWGERGRWILVTCIQIFKCLGRLMLLYKHQEPIIQNPPIPTLLRQRVAAVDLSQNEDDMLLINDPHHNAVSFTLQRSGRVVRKISVSPPNMLRDWKPLTAPINGAVDNQLKVANGGGCIEDINIITKSVLIAETLYVIKPIIHLGCMRLFGTKTWKPWMIALIMDLASSQIYHNHRRKHILFPGQRMELSRRTAVLLLYLIRSPFYENYTKERINRFLKACGNKIPFAGVICNPIAQYLPIWQDTYFYMWST